MKRRIVADGIKMLWKPMAVLALVETANIYLGLAIGTVLGDFTERILVYDVQGALRMAGALLLCIFLSTLALPLAGLFGNYLLFMDSLRHDRFIFDTYFRMPFQMQRRVALGEVQYRVENDPNQFRLTLLFMVKYVLCVVACVPVLAVALGRTDSAMLLVVTMLSLVKWLASEGLGRILADAIRGEREFNTQMRKFEMDISGQPWLFSSFGWEDRTLAKIRKAATEGFALLLSKTFRGRAFSEAANVVGGALYSLLILLAGCAEMGRGKVSLGDVLAVLVIFPVMEKTIDMIGYCVKNRKGLEDILERMAFFYQAGDGKGQEMAGNVGEIRARGLFFSYGETPVLENCCLTINNRKTAICGENGKGKSTLLKIFCGFLLDYQGEVYIGDEKLRGREEEWFSRFGYVPQEPFLFRETLEENIAMAVDYDRGRMEEAIAMTGLGRLAGKTVSNESVSGGERQRIALARALYCRREWIFMDEPSNNLDADTVKWLKEFIAGTDRRLVYVTHDRELMEGAERMIVLGREV